MPIYNFKCEDCGSEFEIKATVEENTKREENKFRCPQCQSKSIKQQITGANYVKGGQSGSGCAGGCCGC